MTSADQALGVPSSSAPIEELLSIAGMVFSPEWCQLTDKTFEQLKCTWWHLRWKERERKKERKTDTWGNEKMKMSCLGGFEPTTVCM